MDWFRGEEVFYRAVRSLVGLGDLPDRVISAANELVHLNETDLPADIHAKLGAVIFGRQDVPPTQWENESGQIERMVRTMSGDELILIAPQILDLYLELLAVLPPERPANPQESLVPKADS